VLRTKSFITVQRRPAQHSVSVRRSS
jgi:hypothetical protein